MSVISACKWRPVMSETPVLASRGMVVSAHPLASEAGRDALAKGGNAVDAAVACAFALSVVEPYSSGLGGGGFMLIYPGPGRDVEVLDYREVAPGAASRDMYLVDGKVSPGLSMKGPLASGVPGTVAGLADALKRYGTMSLAEVMAPAIGFAEDGFVIDDFFITRLMVGMAVFDRDAREIFQNDGRMLRPGRRLVQQDLADTLRLIAEHGPEVFYNGEIAEAIADDMEKKGGIITLEDLAAYKTRWKKPVTGAYRGYQIVSMPPPSSGGVAVIQTLNILEEYDLASMGHNSADSAHLMAEAMKLAFADRAAFMGDPAFANVPVAKLVDKSYADLLRDRIDMDRARKSSEVTPGGGEIPLPDSWEDAGGTKLLAALIPGTASGKHTTHLSVVDAKGGAVSLTQTINTPFGSGVAISGTGIIMNI